MLCHDSHKNLNISFAVMQTFQYKACLTETSKATARDCMMCIAFKIRNLMQQHACPLYRFLVACMSATG